VIFKTKITKNEINIFLFYFLLIGGGTILSAQRRLDFKTLDSLKFIYSIDKKYKRIAFDNPMPPPPPDIKKSRKCFKCERKHNIPDSVFLNSYPFNADSILIYYPNSNCDDFVNYHLLKKMEKSEIVLFADLLYNYDYKKQAKLTIISISLSSFDRPDLKIAFYHKNEQNDLLLYFDEESQVRFESSFDETMIIDWGAYCEERYNQLKRFFYETYCYEIKECIEEEPEIPDLIRLDYKNK